MPSDARRDFTDRHARAVCATVPTLTSIRARLFQLIVANGRDSDEYRELEAELRARDCGERVKPTD